MENLILTRNDSILTITVNRPKALNALNRKTLEELSEVISTTAQDSSVRAVVITGSGEKAFVAGADISGFPELDAAAAEQFALFGQSVFSRFEALPQPVIAAVNGFSLGGGLELALSCDFMIAAENAKLGLPECKLGLLPGFGGTVRLARKAGMSVALELAMSGEMISAARGLELKIVNRVVPVGQALTEAEALAKIMATRAPLAVKAIKQQIYQTQSLSFEEALKAEAKRFGEIFKTQDARLGVDAFLKGQPANFRGE